MDGAAPEDGPLRAADAPRAPDTEILMIELDRYRLARGTVPIFDALLEENPIRLALELGRVPLHPCRPLIIGWLQRRDQPLPSLPSPESLLLSEMEERLKEQERKINLLSRQIETLNEIGFIGRRVNEIYAAVCVLFVGAAILGWMAAFGLLPFTPEAPTTLPPDIQRAP